LSELYLGLMSGTSLDGVDGVLADFSQNAPRVLGHVSQAFPEKLKQTLLALNTVGPDELHRAALASNALVRVYAEVVKQVLSICKVSPEDIRAIGAHGQTVRHRPQMFDGTGYTLQLNQPALLAELTGIDVVADFRSRDVAAGGQGAPLVPPFHQAIFGQLPGSTCVLNVGGISNITVLSAKDPLNVLGFDCGPGNALMDAWCQMHTGAPYDNKGAWAARGNVHGDWLQCLMAEPFFNQAPPKSTGRDLFNIPWLHSKFKGFESLSAQDVQATLTELTARTCADCVLRFAPECSRLIVCGGGALNDHLMRRLQILLSGCQVSSSDSFGVPATQVEALAFAWLARQCVQRNTASLKSATGAKGARILGAIYPA
jgi:anhydro-N-acetylmuramic acid kinase